MVETANASRKVETPTTVKLCQWVNEYSVILKIDYYSTFQDKRIPWKWQMLL
jgi:hypothetical protein